MEKKLKSFNVYMSYLSTTLITLKAQDEDEAAKEAWRFVHDDPSLLEEMKNDGSMGIDNIEVTE